MTQTLNVLFLCTGNSARSIIGEALLNHWGKERFHAFSAGSQPKDDVNPLTLRLLRAAGLPTEKSRSKSWSEFAKPEAPKMDFVITVCDSAAAETCPVWPGQPISAHWGIPDPAATQGTEPEKMAAFWDAFNRLDARIKLLIALPIVKLDKMALKREVVAIGQQQDVPQSG